MKKIHKEIKESELWINTSEEKLTHKYFSIQEKKERDEMRRKKGKFSSIQDSTYDGMDKRQQKTYFSCVTYLSILDESRVYVWKVAQVGYI